MNVDVKFIKPIPEKQIDRFMDRTVHNVARITLDSSVSHVPRLTGNMSRDLLGRGVVGGNAEYSLGYTSNADYAPFVYRMNGVRWTNVLSYSQWYHTYFKYNNAWITSNAVVRALKEI